jgi:hypothetical protein
MKLRDILMEMNSDELLDLVRLLGGNSATKRKADRISYITRTMLDAGSVRSIWQELDPVSRRAISVAYHRGGEFEPRAFMAQYGDLPERPESNRWYHVTPILFDLFVVGDVIPEDVMPLLEELVLPQERFRLEGRPDVPASIDMEGDVRTLTVVETETTGRTDLLTFLHLVDREQLRLGAKTRRLTDASLRTVLANLATGDYREPPEKATATTTIRPTGLDVFTQESGLMARDGQLSKSGREYLRTQDPEILLDAFETWTSKGSFDELSRISLLKGLNAKDTELTPPAGRRDKVIEALSWCPAGRWIDMISFYRALLIWDLDFEVEDSPYSNLTIGSGYYATELEGETYWLVTHGLYANIVIWEYLATIGAVDVAFLAEDYGHLIDEYYMMHEEPLSLYDGLIYIRINPWGEYLLGLADEYVPSMPVDTDLFTIDENLRLSFFDPPAPNVRLQLEPIAEPVDVLHYQLDQVKLLSAVEDGQDFDQIVDFLMQTVQDDDELAKLSRPLDNNTLLVTSGNLARFRTRLKTIGYVLK